MVGITSETSEVQGTTSQIFLSSTYVVREHAPARSRVHLREHGARALSANMHASLGETSLSFLRLLSKQFSCHLAIFSCHNKSQRAFLKKKNGTPRVVSGRRRPHASYAPGQVLASTRTVAFKRQIARRKATVS